MTENDWLDGTDPAPLRRWVEVHATPRKRVLADVAQCRRLGPLIDPDLGRVVELLEQFADGRAALADVERCGPVLADLAGRARERWQRADRDLTVAARAWEDACHSHSEAAPTAPLFTGAEWLRARAARLEAATRSAAVQAGRDVVVAILCGDPALVDLFVGGYETAEREAEASVMTEFAANWERRAEELAERFGRSPRQKRQVATESLEWAERGLEMLDAAADRRIREARIRAERAFGRTLRDLFGNPFRPVAFDPRWRTEDVLGLARGIYEERAFERMPLLADALMDAGCADDRVLAHCREPGAHYRGCWVVDAVLGLESGRAN
jgi:hypothetical protein